MFFFTLLESMSVDENNGAESQQSEKQSRYAKLAGKFFVERYKVEIKVVKPLPSNHHRSS